MARSIDRGSVITPSSSVMKADHRVSGNTLLCEVEAPIAISIRQARRMPDAVIGIAIAVQIDIALISFGHDEDKRVAETWAGLSGHPGARETRQQEFTKRKSR